MELNQVGQHQDDDDMGGGETEMTRLFVRYEFCAARSLSKNNHFLQLLNAHPNQLYKWTFGQPQSIQPPIQYRISLLKTIIKLIETGDYWNEDSTTIWYDELERLNSYPELAEPFYRIYVLCDKGLIEENFIKIYENDSAFVSDGTTGFVTWEASIELSKRLSEYIKSFQNCWILELGCGCGFLATATLKINPQLRKYIMSDGHGRALGQCQRNLTENKLDPDRGGFELIDWTEDKVKFLRILEKNCKLYGQCILLGADIIFNVELIPPLLELFQSFLQTLDLNSYILLSCTIRNESTLQCLYNSIGAAAGIKLEQRGKWGNGVILQLSKNN